MFSDFYPQIFTAPSGSGSPNPLKRIPGLVSRSRTAPNYVHGRDRAVAGVSKGGSYTDGGMSLKAETGSTKEQKMIANQSIGELC
jgi:hypothetical protein